MQFSSISNIWYLVSANCPVFVLSQKMYQILEIEENFISKGCFEKFFRFYIRNFNEISSLVPELEHSLALIGHYLIRLHCGNFNYYQFWLRPHPSIRKCRHFFRCLKFYLETSLSCCEGTMKQPTGIGCIGNLEAPSKKNVDNNLMAQIWITGTTWRKCSHWRNNYWAEKSLKFDGVHWNDRS